MNKHTLKTTIMVKKEVEEPVEVQICPVCGSVPRADNDLFSLCGTFDLGAPVDNPPKYKDRAKLRGNPIIVSCPNCGLQARLQDWNKLSYEEDKQWK